MNKFFHTQLFETFSQDIELCLLIWPLFGLWSYMSFFLQKLILKGFSKTITVIIQHLSQAGLFVFSSYIILINNWCVTHSLFVTVEACIIFMKMHSYTTTNRDYRQQKEIALKQGSQVLSTYPKNVNLKNFTWYIMMPVLTYEQKYPLKQKIDKKYLIWKLFSGIIILFTCYLIFSEFLYPFIGIGLQMNALELFLRMIFPFTLLNLMVFWFVFENIVIFFAELTRLSDREFYLQWWNSKNFFEFNRQKIINRFWNTRVYQFLYRHVYLQCILRYDFKNNNARLLTFMFSSLLHQFVISLVFKTIMPYMIVFMMFQIPLFVITKNFNRNIYGTYIFWFGITIGPSLIMCLYLRSNENMTKKFQWQNK